MDFENKQNEAEKPFQEQITKNKENLEISDVVNECEQQLNNSVEKTNNENEQAISHVENYPGVETGDIKVAQEIVSEANKEVNQVVENSEKNVDKIVGENDEAKLEGQEIPKDRAGRLFSKYANDLNEYDEKWGKQEKEKDNQKELEFIENFKKDPYQNINLLVSNPENAKYIPVLLKQGLLREPGSNSEINALIQKIPDKINSDSALKYEEKQKMVDNLVKNIPTETVKELMKENASFGYEVDKLNELKTNSIKEMLNQNDIRNIDGSKFVEYVASVGQFKDVKPLKEKVNYLLNSGYINKNAFNNNSAIPENLFKAGLKDEAKIIIKNNLISGASRDFDKNVMDFVKKGYMTEEELGQILTEQAEYKTKSLETSLSQANTEKQKNESNLNLWQERQKMVDGLKSKDPNEHIEIGGLKGKASEVLPQLQKQIDNEIDMAQKVIEQKNESIKSSMKEIEELK